MKGFTINSTIDGKFTPISFKRGCTLGSTATFTTSDPKIQDVLESNSSFNIKYYLEKEERIGEDETMAFDATPTLVTTTEEEKEVVDILDSQTFKNIVELRRALQDKGIDVSQITNVKAAESLAKKNGYNYTVEKSA